MLAHSHPGPSLHPRLPRCRPPGLALLLESTHGPPQSWHILLETLMAPASARLPRVSATSSPVPWALGSTVSVREAATEECEVSA